MGRWVWVGGAFVTIVWWNKRGNGKISLPKDGGSKTLGWLEHRVDGVRG